VEPLLCRKRILVSGLPYEVIRDSDGRWEGGGVARETWSAVIGWEASNPWCVPVVQVCLGVLKIGAYRKDFAELEATKIAVRFHFDFSRLDNYDHI
jgi:hypothetical protein